MSEAKTAEAIQEELDLVRSRIAEVRRSIDQAVASRNCYEEVEIELRSILDVARGEAPMDTPDVVSERARLGAEVNRLMDENHRLAVDNDAMARNLREVMLTVPKAFRPEGPDGLSVALNRWAEKLTARD